LVLKSKENLTDMKMLIQWENMQLYIPVLVTEHL